MTIIETLCTELLSNQTDPEICNNIIALCEHFGPSITECDILTAFPNVHGVSAVQAQNIYNSIVNKQCVRTRRLLKYLIISLCRVPKALPPGVFGKKYPAITYPNSIRKNKLYSEFGLVMEEIVAIQFSKIFKHRFLGHVQDSINMQSFLTTTEIGNFQNYLETFETKIAAEIKAIFKNVKYIFRNLSIVHKNVVGHPDIVVEYGDGSWSILDVKVFARMVGGSDSREIRAQLAVYVSLARANNKRVKNVGLVMPWNRDPIIELWPIDKWDSKHLIDLAIKAANNVDAEPQCMKKWTQLLQQYNVGHHINNQEGFKWNNPDIPIQLFLYGNNPSNDLERKGREKIKDGNINMSKMRAFIHAPYNLNLCKTEPYICESAINYMQDADALGFRGVVFHVGHHADSKVGLENMRKNIEKVLSTGHKAHFILETPCGNANELLPNPTEFAEFASKFASAPNFGLCIDTCHVFVSGYLPDDYIKFIDHGMIKLIHFNGSRKKQGAKADGHAFVGYIQNIPDESLINILIMAEKRNIPCIVE